MKAKQSTAASLQLHQRPGSPPQLQRDHRIDTRLPLGERFANDNTEDSHFSKVPYGTYTIRGSQEEELEMQCLKEQIHVDSYVNMIRRMEREVETLHMRNSKIGKELSEREQRFVQLQQQMEDEETRHMTDMNELLNEADSQEQRISQMLNCRRRIDDDVTHQTLEEMEQQVDCMKNQLLEMQRKSLSDFSGLVSFIEFLECSNADLCRQIESLPRDESSEHVLVRDYNQNAPAANYFS